MSSSNKGKLNCSHSSISEHRFDLLLQRNMAILTIQFIPYTLSLVSANDQKFFFTISATWCLHVQNYNQGRIRDAISYLCFRRRSQFIYFNRRPKYPKIWQNCKGSENLRVFSVKNNLNNSKLINLAHLLLLDTLALILVRSMIQWYRILVTSAR